MYKKNTFMFLFAAMSAVSLCAHTIKNLSFSEAHLYPVHESFNHGHLTVSNEHQIFFEEFGNPTGVPVLVVHGGPGLGCDKSLSQYFDLTYYHVVMFDQRGCGRSVSSDPMKDNTPQDSVRDMEKLREHLGIETWILFGGSYGSLLSILYGETHPDRVVCFVLRGIFLGRQQDYENLLSFQGMAQFFPESYQSMLSLFSKREKVDLIGALDRRIMSQDEKDYMPLARTFMYYDILCSRLCLDAEKAKNMLVNKKLIVDVSRAFIHYAAHEFFLQEDQLLNNIKSISHIPALIVHGRYDLICPPKSAYDLHMNWPASELQFITNAGHSALEPAIGQALKNAMDELKKRPA